MMALLPSTLGRAGPLSSDVLDLQVTEHGPHARVVTVGGEIDALTAPELGAWVTSQLAAVSLVVVDLDRVRFLGSAGLSVLLAANELATQENRYLWLVFPRRGMVNRALEVTGLSERFNVAETVAAALIRSL
jgi:anti-sigma B factor antagonist